MTKRVFLLLGGMDSWDGWFDSAGMLEIAHRCAKLAIPCTVYTWGDYAHTAADIMAFCRNQPDNKAILVGYSGGGSRATYLNRQFPFCPVELLIGYDPSPKWDCLPIGSGIKKAVCYFNENPELGDLGGGTYTNYPGQDVPIDIIKISEEHLKVQFDTTLHDKTMELIQGVE